MRLLLSLAGLLPTLTHAVSPLVKLDYASYQGVALSNSVTQWLGIPFAAPPIGNLRFAAPQDPQKQTSIQDASEQGSICLPTLTDPPTNTTLDLDEDCLYLAVYAPSKATSSSRLPVYVFIQGGGFNGLANPNLNGTGLVAASNEQIVVVTFNYRVGPYGFLASKEISKGASLNNGLKDQRKALQWVQKYITSFGGDPKHVTLGGDSAGGQSVTLHLTAYGGRNDNLFHATAAESQSFSSLFTPDESQFAYDALVQRANCGSKSDTLACLRGLTSSQLQAINTNIAFPGGSAPPLYMYGPTLDHDFLSDYTYNAFGQGKFLKLPAIYGDDTNEGTIFAPHNTSTLEQSDDFLKNQFPTITDEQISQWNDLYPVDSTPSFVGAGRFWRQVSDGYGELRYVCPGLFLSNTYGQKLIPNWNYRWNVVNSDNDDDGYGVTHTIEVVAIWGPDYVIGKVPDSYRAGNSNAGVASAIQSYWISFIRSYNPNTYRQPGSPTWKPFIGSTVFNKGISMSRLLLETGATGMETVPLDQRARCEYLWSIGVSLKQ